MAPVDVNMPTPARWPYSRVLNGAEPGLGLWQSVEVVQRTVSPEAQKYFDRILQVAQSELQKLLIHKVQNLFDPSAKSPRLPKMGDDLSVIQQKGRLLKEKPAEEGQHLAAYIVTVLSRIMVDFSNFADLVLRWQQNEVGSKQPRRPATANQVADKGGKGEEWRVCEPLLERLERQDKQNTELETKCSHVLAELQERKRQFLRERAIFKQRLSLIRAYAVKKGDQKLLELLEHDVQFYDEQGRSVEDVKEEYERRLQMKEAQCQEALKRKDFDLLGLQGEIARLEEANAQLKQRRMTDRVGPLQQKLERAEKILEETEAELEESRQEVKRLKNEHQTLQTQLSAAQQSLASLEESLAQLELEKQQADEQGKQKEERIQLLEQELSSLRARQDKAEEEKMQLLETQRRLEAQLKELSAKRDPSRLVREVLWEQAQSLEPDDRLERATAELEQLRREVTELTAAAHADATERLVASAGDAEARRQLQAELLDAQRQLQSCQDLSELLRLAQQEAEVQKAKAEAAEAACARAQAAADQAQEQALQAKLAQAEASEREAILASRDGRVCPSNVTRTDQSQQTEDAEHRLAQNGLDTEQLEQLQNLQLEVQVLRVREAQLLKSIKMLQEQLSRLQLQTHSSHEDVTGIYAANLAESTVDASLPPSPGREESRADTTGSKSLVSMLNYPRVLTLGGGWLQGVSKKHPRPLFQPHSPRSGRGRSPDLPASFPELSATRLPSHSPSRSPTRRDPKILVPRTAQAKRSTVCRSPPRDPPVEAEPRQRLRRVPAELPAARPTSRAGHPLGRPDESEAFQDFGDKGHASAPRLASIDMATAAGLHQRRDPSASTARDSRRASGVAADSMPTSRFPRPRSAAQLHELRRRPSKGL